MHYKTQIKTKLKYKANNSYSEMLVDKSALLASS